MYITFHNLEAYFAVIYVNYFVPGSLKIQTNVYEVGLKELWDAIDVAAFSRQLFESRRWLPKGEAPFPGYCRAPGSGVCLPMLCNCQKLLEIWNKINNTQIKLKGKIH
ncbi:unnamed protein product, partial [Iphiclides podalirius]